MAKEDNITVPRWFLEVVENALRIQNNINLDKKTGETCQDRNIKESLNGLRKLLRGEELTGGERLESLQPSLPSNPDEAAEEIVRDWLAYGDGEYKKLVIAGAEWMAGQGWKEVDNKNYPVPDKKKIYIVYTKEHYHLARVINHPKDDDLYQWMCTEFPNYRYDMCEGDSYLEIRKKQ